MAEISVFIINYNGAAFIEACLESVLNSKCSVDIEVIVVDNQSTDHSIDILKTYKDKVTVVKNKHNSGFSKGNNIAASYATGNYYFLLNNDTVLPEDTIQKLYDYHSQFSNIGALVPKLLNQDGTIQCPGSIFGQWKFKSKTAIDVSFVAGAALMMNRGVYEQIGGLDDHLFFYNDDVDLCKTLLKNNYRLVYYPDAQLTHFGGLSTQFRKLGSLIEGYRGGMYVCYKHYGNMAYFLYRFLVLFDLIPRLLIHCVRSVFDVDQKQYVKAYLRVLTINLKNDIFVEHPVVDVEVL